MYSAHQVRSKSRMAVKRREDVVEQEEIESGEINLIPYLDIVTNLMLFLLASVAGGAIIFGQLNTMLPDKAPAGSTSDKPPDTNPDEVPLKLVVQVLKERIMLWSVSGREGTLQDPIKFPYSKDNLTGSPALARTGGIGATCDGAYMCETGTCDGGKCVQNPNPNAPVLPVFDYRALNDALYQIAAKHYTGKHRPLETYQAVLMADDSTPYETLISVMGAMRCKMPPVGELSERCYLPTADEKLKASDTPLDDINRLYDTDRVEYNADHDALFNDILFSRGFE